MANNDLKRVGLVLSADGAEDFQKTLRNVNSTLKDNYTEFKKAKASYDENTTGLTKLKDTMKFCQAQAETYGDKVTLLKGKLSDLQKAEKENFTALSQTKEKTEQLRKELEDLTSAENKDEQAIKAKTAELTKSEKELKKLVDQENDYNVKIKNTKSSLDDATISAEKYAKSAEQMQKKIESGSQGLEDLSKKLDGVSDKMKKAGDDLTKGVTAPVVALGAGAMTAWSEVDEGLDTIVKKTGATGDALADMQTRAKDLATSIPTDFATAGEAIGEVNTRFGLTGDELEKVSAQFIKFAKINDADMTGSIDSIQKSMSAFGLTADQIPAVLDTITKASQDSGIGTDKLTSDLVANAGVLREMNMSYSDSVALFATLEKSGAEASDVMSGLSKAWANATKDGISLSDALAQSLSSEETALDLFGNKAGTKMYDLFQSGTVSLDMFNGGLTSLNDNLGTVEGTFDALTDPSDEMVTILNELKALGYELGQAIGPVLLDIVKEALPIIQSITDAWKSLSPETQEMIVKLALIAAAIGPVLTAGGKIVGLVSGIISGISGLIAGGGVLSTVLGGIITLLTGPVGIIALIGAVIAGITAFLVHLYNTNEEFRSFLDGLWDGIVNFIKGIGEKIGDFFSWLDEKWNGLIDWIKSIPSKIKTFFDDFKMPKLEIEGSLNPADWLKQGLPSLKLKWMAEGGILNHPTIFGAGEAGSEAVMPLDTLHAWINDTNAQQTSDIIGAMENACFRGFSKALQAYKPGVYLDDDKVAEIFSDMLAQNLKRS